MIRLLFILLFLGNYLNSLAQDIEIGETIDTSHKDYNAQFYREFIKDEGGYLYSGVFYNSNYKSDKDKGASYIEKFDKNLNIVKAKKIESPNMNVSRMLAFFAQKNQFYAINLEQEQSENNLYLYQIDKNTLEATKKELVLSANKIYKFQRYNHCKVVVSKDRKSVAAFAFSREKNKLGLTAVMYDQNLNRTWETTTILPFKAVNNGSYRFKEVYMDKSQENTYLIIENEEQQEYVLCSFIKKTNKVTYEKIARKQSGTEYIQSISISKINEQVKWLMFTSKKWSKNVDKLKIVDVDTKEKTLIEIGQKMINNGEEYLYKGDLYSLAFKNIFTYPEEALL